MDATGAPLDVTAGNPKYPHYWSDAPSIAVAMRTALGIVGVPSGSAEEL